MRQFVTVKMRPTDKRAYTYHNDDAPVAVGDQVKVPARDGGWMRADVIEVSAIPPSFPTKAILGPMIEGDA